MGGQFAVRAMWAVLFSASLGACVGGPTSRPPAPEPPPSSATLQDRGYADIIEYGTQLAHEQGYDVEAAEAVPVGRNLWRVRFGLPPKGSGKFLELEFDAANRKLVNSIVFQRISDSVLSPPRSRSDAGVGP